MNYQLPPHDESAEWSLLACAVGNPDIIPAIQSELFYVELCRRILLKMQFAWVEKMECVRTSEQFEHWLSKALEGHLFSPLIEAVNKLPSAAGWTYWRDILTDAYRARELEKLKPKISEISERVGKGESPNEVLLEISRIAKLWQGSKSESIEALLPRVLNELEQNWKSGKYPGSITGFPTFDKLTRGLQNNRLYLIAGRPGKGKSTLAMNLAVGAAYRDSKCLFITLEMSSEEVVKRAVSSESRVSEQVFSDQQATETDFQKVTAAMLRIKRLPIRINDSVRSLSDIVMACHKAASEGVNLIFVDYLQKIVVPNFRYNRTELVTQISGAMKDIAMSLRLPVVCCAQLNRDSEKDEREPTLADLRDSGSIEQDADVVALLHEKKEQTDLIIAKNRSGQRGRIAFEFNRPIFRFEEKPKI